MAADDIADSVAGIRAEVVNDIVDSYAPRESVDEEWDLPGLATALEKEFGLQLDPKAWLDADPELNNDGLRERLVAEIEGAYQHKVEQVGPPVMRHLEKAVMLQELDRHWREHLAAMDYLRQGIHLRAYAQKNPKQEYKREAFELFSALLERIKHGTITLLSRLQVRTEAEIEAQEREHERQLARRLSMQHAAPASAISADAGPVAGAEPEALASGPPRAPVGSVAPGPTAVREPITPVVRDSRKVGRNEPCPCGSGKKYKHCHGALAREA
jgi:preprotein translocase subunit SecA